MDNTGRKPGCPAGHDAVADQALGPDSTANRAVGPYRETLAGREKRLRLAVDLDSGRLGNPIANKPVLQWFPSFGSVYEPG